MTSWVVVKRERGFYEPAEVWTYIGARHIPTLKEAGIHMRDYQRGYVKEGGDPEDFKVVEEREA